MYNILVAPNSFKECASALDIAELIELELRQYFNDVFVNIKTLPIADGGDGFLEFCSIIYDLNIHTTSISAPWCCNEKFKVQYGYNPDINTIYIETAKVLGLNIVPVEKRNPLQLSSKGLGELIGKCIEIYDTKNFVIGVGGTATIDMGIGALSEMGLQLFNKDDKPVKALPVSFTDVASISYNSKNIDFEFIIDVNNPLLGNNGAAKVYGPQKGASEVDVKRIEEGFTNIVNLVDTSSGIKDYMSGAGGGIPAGFGLFHQIKQTPSEDIIIGEIEKLSTNFNLIITGEGSLDEQSLMDKGTNTILNYAEKSNATVAIFCGVNKLHKTNFRNVLIIELSKYFSSADESMNNFGYGIKLAVRELAERIKDTGSFNERI